MYMYVYTCKLNLLQTSMEFYCLLFLHVCTLYIRYAEDSIVWPERWISGEWPAKSTHSVTTEVVIFQYSALFPYCRLWFNCSLSSTYDNSWRLMYIHRPHLYFNGTQVQCTCTCIYILPPLTGPALPSVELRKTNQPHSQL